MDWLSRLDPNVIVPIGVAVFGWLWRAARGEKKADSKSIIDSIIENFAAELLDSYHSKSGDVTEYLKKSRRYIEERIWLVLAKRGIKGNALSRKLVNEALERWVAWVGQELLRRRAEDGPLSRVLK